MTKSKLRNANIFAMESVWTSKVTHPFPTVGTLFSLIHDNIKGFEYTVLNSNTVEEVEHSLDLAKKNVRNFGILYFASHGEENGIITLSKTRETRLSLEDLSEIMGKRFKSWGVHFGSCSTLNTSDKRIKKFMKQTGVQMLTGYTEDVFWVESTAFELMFFHGLSDEHYYSDLRVFRSDWMEYNSVFSERLGFKFYLKGD